MDEITLLIWFEVRPLEETGGYLANNANWIMPFYTCNPRGLRFGRRAITP
jgi:hypothetical protein